MHIATRKRLEETKKAREEGRKKVARQREYNRKYCLEYSKNPTAKRREWVSTSAAPRYTPS